MTSRRWTQMVCDGCNGQELWKELTVAGTRAAARAAGWHHINPARDICPACWKARKR